MCSSNYLVVSAVHHGHGLVFVAHWRRNATLIFWVLKTFENNNECEWFIEMYRTVALCKWSFFLPIITVAIGASRDASSSVTIRLEFNACEIKRDQQTQKFNNFLLCSKSFMKDTLNMAFPAYKSEQADNKKISKTTKNTRLLTVTTCVSMNCLENVIWYCLSRVCLINCHLTAFFFGRQTRVQMYSADF